MKNKIYPFKFLDSYTAEDKDIFFGRDEEIKQLYEMIYQSDILLLYGASGTGKTSLIQCGLASQFQKHDWLEVFIRRHKNLNDSLNKSLISVGGQNGEESREASENLNWLNDLMGNGQIDVATETLSQTQIFLKNIYLKHFRPIYLIFDQFEELFILGSKKEQAQFIATVQEILKVEQPVKLIFSIREEYLGSLYEFEKVVPELLRKKLRIDPMNFEKVKAVVLGATRSKKSIVHINEEEADAISEQIFEKIRGKEKTLTIQLPYLQVFLDKFYRHISKDKAKNPTTEATYTLNSLAEIGDIGNILRDFLDEQIVEIASKQACKRKTIWKILSPFVTIDGTKEPIGIDTLCQNFPDIPKELIEHVVIALMNNRILRYLEEEELYEIAHDSLALRIAEKRSDDEIALLEVRNLIKSQSLLKDEARELFSEKQLDFIDPFLERLSLNPGEIQLIEESKNQVVQFKKEAIKRRRITQAFVSVFILIVLILLIFLVFSSYKKVIAEKVNQQNEKIINSMDFYLGKYALGFKHGKYGFIDKNGDFNIQFEYDKGEPFNYETGFAEMEINTHNKNKSHNKYLIDTIGNKYRLINVATVLKKGSIVESKNARVFDPRRGRTKRDTGKLALNFPEITQVDDILEVLNDIKQKKNIKDRVELLFLNGTNLEKFPDYIIEYKELKELNLSSTGISILPPSFNQLFNLKKLNLSNTKLTSLPESIGQLDQLNDLRLPASLEKLPISIGNLKNLTVLDLKNTRLKSLPEFIWQLDKLTRLGLPASLEKLPTSIGNLKNLTFLDLSNTQLISLPESIGRLKQLNDLKLPASLEKLPTSIGHLKNLTVLDLDETQLTSLPKSIWQLNQLKDLRLPASLEKLPASIGNLKRLTFLDLSSTQLTSLPESIWQLNQLKDLRLPASLEKLPASIGNLKKLTFLDLSSTQLTSLPESIGQLDQLVGGLRLPASLEKFPVSIGNLKYLKELDLSNTQLTSLPESIWKLDQLEKLRLPASLKKLPTNIGDLKYLKELDLSNTQLISLPESIGKLNQLTWLELPASLKKIPVSIGNLKNLSSVSLYNANSAITKTELKALQKKLPNCYFEIKDE